MIRRLATLEVYVDDDVNGLPTACGSAVDKLTGEQGEHHKLVLNIAKNPYSEGVKPNMATEFAHELGHFMANTLGAPGSKAAMRLMMEAARKSGKRVLDVGAISGPLGDRVPPEVFAMEAEAWQFARLIHPGLNEGQAKDALDSYKNE